MYEALVEPLPSIALCLVFRVAGVYRDLPQAPDGSIGNGDVDRIAPGVPDLVDEPQNDSLLFESCRDGDCEPRDAIVVVDEHLAPDRRRRT